MLGRPFSLKVRPMSQHAANADQSSSISPRAESAHTDAAAGEKTAGASLDDLALTALMSSRLCHDLVNPVGALSSGLDVLSDESMDDELRDEALDLVRTSADKAVATLKYARLAYGMGGDYAGEVPFDEARDVLAALYACGKSELDWAVSAPAAPKEEVKAVLLLAHAAAESVPRGGRVRVEGAGGVYVIEATGARVLLNEASARVLAGDAGELKPKFAPLYIAGVLARRTGGAAEAHLADDRMTMRVSFRRR